MLKISRLANRCWLGMICRTFAQNIGHRCDTAADGFFLSAHLTTRHQPIQQPGRQKTTRQGNCDIYSRFTPRQATH